MKGTIGGQVIVWWAGRAGRSGTGPRHAPSLSLRHRRISEGCRDGVLAEGQDAVLSLSPEAGCGRPAQTRCSPSSWILSVGRELWRGVLETFKPSVVGKTTIGQCTPRQSPSWP